MEKEICKIRYEDDERRKESREELNQYCSFLGLQWNNGTVEQWNSGWPIDRSCMADN
jgi:hypothetical protein